MHQFTFSIENVQINLFNILLSNISWLGESSMRESMFKIWWEFEEALFSFISVPTNWSFPPFSGPVMETNLYLATLSKLKLLNNHYKMISQIYLHSFTLWTIVPCTCLHCENDLLETVGNLSNHLSESMSCILLHWRQLQLFLIQFHHFYRQAELYILLIYPPEHHVTLCSMQN